MQQLAVLALLVGLTVSAPAGEALGSVRVPAGTGPGPAQAAPTTDQANDEPAAGQDARWPTPEVRVSFNSSSDYTDYENQRNVVVDASGTVHAVWYNMSGFYPVIYKRSTDGGVTWVDSTSLSGLPPYDSYYNRFPSLALDSTGNVHCVWTAGANTSAYNYVVHRERSPSGTWSAVTIVANTAANYYWYSPTVACSPNGRVHVAWQGRYYDPAFVNYYYITTRERVTGTWQAPVDHDYNTFVKSSPAIAVDRAGNVHLTWRGYHSGSTSYYQVMYRRRTGANWGSTADVTQASYSLSLAAPSIATDYVTNAPFIVLKASSYRLVLCRDSAGTWLRDTLTPSGWSRLCYAPQVAPGRNGWMHVAYQGYSDAYTGYYQARYGTWTPTDGWTGFEDATGVNNTGRYTPSVFADSLGDIHLLWYDGRDGDNEVYYKHGLRPFANDVAVTSVNNVWPFQARGASFTVGVTVRNQGTATRPPGVPVILEIAGPGAYAYADTAYTTWTLAKGQTQSLSFSPNWTAPSTKGPYLFTLRSALSGDQDVTNDTLRRDVYVYPGIYETWSSSTFPPAGWDTVRLAGTGSPQWARTTSSQYYYTGSGAAQFRSYVLPAGNAAALVSPRLDLTVESSDSLVFYHLHLPFSGVANDSLEVQVSTDLGANWTTLAVYTGIDTPWSRKALSLEGVPQTNQCRVRFVGRSQYCQYLNVDDVMAPALYVPYSDVQVLASFAMPSYPLIEGEADTVSVWVRGLGRSAVGSFNVYAEIDGSVAGSASVAGLAVGETRRVDVPVATPAGEHRAVFRFWHDLAGDEVRANDTTAGLDDWVFPEGTWRAIGFDWDGSTWPPTGWDTLNADGGSYCWQRYYSSSTAHTGRYYTGSYYESSTLRNDDWLVTPAFQPVHGLADSFGLHFRAYSLTYPESLEVWVMRGQNTADTIARLYAALESTQNYQVLRVGLDAWDDSTVCIGIRNLGLDMYYLCVDDAWWRRTQGGPDAPALLLPPDGAGGQPVDGALVWSAAFNADVYDVYLDTVSPPLFKAAENLTDTTWAYAGLLPQRDYYWSVTARNSAGGSGSPVRAFRTAGTIPVPPGWHEILPGVPAAPSGKAVKDGGWLHWDAGTARIYLMKGYKAGDLFAYNPADSTWTALTPMPLGTENKPPYKGAAGTSDGNGVFYVTKGNNTRGFYKYFAGPDSWVQLPDVPLGASNKKVKGGTDMVYVQGDSGYVYLLKGYKTEFYRFNVTSGQWQTLPDAPSGALPKWDKGSWLVYDGGNTIYAHKAKAHELYTFTLSSGTWSAPMTGMPFFNSRTGKQKKAKDGSDGVYIGGAIYALKGGNTQDFYRHDISTGAWTECETLPMYGSTGKKKRVKAGSGITATDDWESPIYALKGNKTFEFWRYTIGNTPHASPAPARDGVAAERTQGRPVLLVRPNPLAGSHADIRYILPAAGAARLEVIDVAGRCVLARTLGPTPAGSVRLDLSSLPAGVYACRLGAPGWSSTCKLVVHR